GYTEAINGVIKVMNRMGRGYSFEMIRAKALFSNNAKQSGAVIRHNQVKGELADAISTKTAREEKFYGTPISTLEAISGEVDEAES
ncbi:ISL3 family transposase, partial [Candidatus Parcubacteria bacterium]